MANKHSDVITRSVLLDDDVKKIQETLGKPLSAFSFDEVLAAYQKKHKLQETVSVSASVVAAKVLMTVLEGGRLFGEKWRSMVTIHNMTEEKEVVPIITEQDYIVHKGTNTPPKQSGGETVTVELDVTKENKTRSMLVEFRERDIKRKKFPLVQSGLEKAGRKFNKFILDEIVKFALDNAGTTEALGGNNRYVTATNLVAKMDDEGFETSVAAMTPTDFAKVIQTQLGTDGPLPFVTNTMLDQNGNAIRGLQRGEDFMLLGYIPGIKVRKNSDLSTNWLVMDKNSIAFGLYEDISIKDWKDPWKSLQNFTLEATYDMKTHSKVSKGIGKATGV